MIVHLLNIISFERGGIMSIDKTEIKKTISSIEKEVREYIAKPRQFRFTLDSKNKWLSSQEKRKLRRIVLPNGKIFLLPYDQAVEHSTYDNLQNPESIHADYQLRIVKKTHMSGIVLHSGAASKHLPDFEGIPLVLKVDGKSDIPQIEPESCPMASVEKALELDAAAIGTTFYYGSPEQYRIIDRLSMLIEEAHKVDIPVIVWAYPRGRFVDAKGGRDALCNIAGAVKFANDIGAAVVKANMPEPFDSTKRQFYHKTYQELEFNSEDGMKWIVKGCTGYSGLIISGGDKVSDEQLKQKVSSAMKAEADGLVIGRNVFLRKMDDAVRLVNELMKILDEHSTTDESVLC